MTSEDVALAHGDADPRWIGVRRHQAVLCLAGLALAGDGVIRAHAPMVETVLGAALLAACIPGPDGLSTAQYGVVGAKYLLRSKWFCAAVVRSASRVHVDARGRATLRGYSLAHVGRLDLAGRDVESVESLGRFVDALAGSGEDRHVSLHVRTSRDDTRTLLAVDGDATPPPEWSSDAALVERVVDLPRPRCWLLERWTYVRTTDGPRAVLRVRDFTSAAPGRAALAPVQLASNSVSVAVHAVVVAAARARRLAERAVHRVRSDGATTSAAGFRRTARAERSLARLQGRETHVAAGRALMRLGVYVVVRAESLPELDDEVRRVRQALRESGLDCERGRGRQAEWFCRQLPGGPGW